MKTFKQHLKEAEMNDKILYIARGIPGSGKSYTISKIVPNENIFSTDNFWGPNYDFDLKRIGEAHKWNLKRAREAMTNSISPIGVDNTNINWKQMEPYATFAKENGYVVKYLEADSPWWNEISSNLKNPEFTDGDPEFEKAAEFLAKKNTHDVPLFVIKRMLNSWEPTNSLPQ